MEQGSTSIYRTRECPTPLGVPSASSMCSHSPKVRSKSQSPVSAPVQAGLYKQAEAGDHDHRLHDSGERQQLQQDLVTAQGFRGLSHRTRVFRIQVLEDQRSHRPLYKEGRNISSHLGTNDESVHIWENTFRHVAYFVVSSHLNPARDGGVNLSSSKCQIVGPRATQSDPDGVYRSR